jgi:CrcB protein
MGTWLASAGWIALGGAIGSVARWSLSSAVHRWAGSTFPWGTLCVNAIGSLIIGVLSALFMRDALPPSARAFWIVGVLGGFTTFSAFSIETLELLRNGRTGAAFLYALGSVLIGVTLAFAGLRLALAGTPAR